MRSAGGEDIIASEARETGKRQAGGKQGMYYYEKDYIMRLIHGIARMLAKMLFDKELTDDSGLVMFRDEGTDETCDYLRRMVDNGEINAAENRLFELIESSAWEERRLAALIIVFYDYVN